MVRKSRKNRVWKIGLLLLGGAAAVVMGYTGYIWLMERRAHFMNYAAFGIEIPVNYRIHGIDVSKYQDFIDWGMVRDMRVGDVQMSFAFIKATEGLGNEDAFFKRNWKKSGDAGISRGAYHFFLATKSGKAQAENLSIPSSLGPAICRRCWISSRPMGCRPTSCGSGPRNGFRRYRIITM